MGGLNTFVGDKREGAVVAEARKYSSLPESLTEDPSFKRPSMACALPCAAGVRVPAIPLGINSLGGTERGNTRSRP